MRTDEVKAQLRTFTARFVRNQAIRDDEDLFALGFVTSLFAMQLVLFIEKEFAVTVENDDLDFDNFRSIDAMAHLIERKTS